MTGAGGNSVGHIFTATRELNICFNILDVGTNAVPGCNLACLCAQGDGES